MCNKIDFTSKSEAKKTIKSMRNNSKFRNKNKSSSPDRSKNLRPYECNICGLWHLTTLSTNVTRQFRR